MADATHVSTGKPKIAGAIYRAPLGTSLPTDATTALNAAFKSVGYISSDGVTNANGLTVNNIKAWGGDIVYSSETEVTDDFKFMMIETAEIEAAKVAYGNENVSGTLAAGMTIKANSKEKEYASWVIEMILRGSILKRIVIPSAKVTGKDDISYKDDDVTGYGVTLTPQPDEAGNTHYEYLKNKTTS